MALRSVGTSSRCIAVVGMIEWRVERDGSGHPVYGDELVWVLAALVGWRVLAGLLA